MNYLIHLIPSVSLVLSHFLSNLLCLRLPSLSFPDQARFYCFWNESHLDVHISTTFVSNVFSILSFINSILPLSLCFYYYLLFKILDFNVEFVCLFSSLCLCLYLYRFFFLPVSVSPFPSLSPGKIVLRCLLHLCYNIFIHPQSPSKSQDYGITPLKKTFHILSFHNSHTRTISHFSKYTYYISRYTIIFVFQYQGNLTAFQINC